jgi:hypothetical protein
MILPEIFHFFFFVIASVYLRHLVRYFRDTRGGGAIHAATIRPPRDIVPEDMSSTFCCLTRSCLPLCWEFLSQDGISERSKGSSVGEHGNLARTS